MRRHLATAAVLALLLAAALVPADARSEPGDSLRFPRLLAVDPRIDCADAANCRPSGWLAFLRHLGLAELAAPPGGRAYRWLWINEEPGAGGLTAPSIGFVEVVVAADGSGSLRSVWSRKARRISASDIAPFEAALGATAFATLPEQDPDADKWLDYPPEQLMEAVVDGRYHFVHRVGGLRETGVRDAGVMLETLAR